MLRTNRDKLVKISVEGTIQHPGKLQDYITTVGGQGVIFPATGGICYNVKLGMNCMDLLADHIEPGVTTANSHHELKEKAYSMYSCIGNLARVVSGSAAGARGYVCGKHDTSHIMIDFPDDVLPKLSPGDRILVEGCGQGLALLDYPDIQVMNLDPDLLAQLPIRAVGPDTAESADVPAKPAIELTAAHRIPACLLGSGIGVSNCFSGDADIMTQDRDTVEALGLQNLRFGDLVLLEDIDAHYGWTYMKGALTLGVIIHGECRRPGHGPGVTALLSVRKTFCSGVRVVLSGEANLANYAPFKV